MNLKNAVSLSVLSTQSDSSNANVGGSNSVSASHTTNHHHHPTTNNYPFHHINFPTKRNQFLLPKVSQASNNSNMYANQYSSNPALHSIISKMNQNNQSMLPKLYQNQAAVNTILDTKMLGGSKMYSKYA